jgi:hypothetical protein
MSVMIFELRNVSCHGDTDLLFITFHYIITCIILQLICPLVRPLILEAGVGAGAKALISLVGEIFLCGLIGRASLPAYLSLISLQKNNQSKFNL